MVEEEEEEVEEQEEDEEEEEEICRTLHTGMFGLSGEPTLSHHAMPWYRS